MPIEYEKLRNKDKGLYKTVLALASRAVEINEGKKSMVEMKSKRASTLAMREFTEGKLDFEKED